MTLNSRIGEPLSAEVPIYGNDSHEIEATCFSLAPLHDAELPVVTIAQIRLSHNSQGFRLLIAGGPPIAEPVFTIGVRAGCGIDLQRNYILMPEAPLTPGDRRQHPALAAVNPATRQKSTELREPPFRESSQAETSDPTPKPGRVRNKEAPAAPRPGKTIPRDILAELGRGTGDRILIGAEPDKPNPGALEMASRSELGEMGSRMLRLETSLHSLNQQVDHLGAALEVTAETIALRQKLLAAQAQQSPNNSETPPLAGTVAHQSRENSNRGNWLELLLSALAGGGISGAIAHLLSRQRGRSANDPLANRKPAVRRKAMRKG